MKQATLKTRHPYLDMAAEAGYQRVETTLLTMAKLHGEADGKANLPATENYFRSRFAHFAFSTIQQQLDEFAQSTQNVSGVLLAQKLEQSAKENVRMLQAAQVEDQTTRSILCQEAEPLRPNKRHNCIKGFVECGLAFIAISEGALALPGFRAASLPLYSTWLAAVGVAVAVGVAAPVSARFIRKAKTQSKAAYRVAGVLLIALAFFYFLASLRLRAYIADAAAQATGNVDSSEITLPAISPDCLTVTAICFTSFVLFAVALGALIRYYKPREEAEREEAYHEKTKRIRALDERLSSRKAEMAAIESGCRQEQAAALQQYEFAVSYQRRLISLGDKALKLYAATNLRFRSDGCCPDCLVRVPTHHYNSVFGAATEATVA